MNRRLGFWLVAVAWLLATAGSHAVVITQVGIAIDGSGSINSQEFSTQTEGLANALAAIPVDGTVEITVVQFSSSARVEVAPTVIDSEATRDAIASSIQSMAQLRGGTDPEDGIDLLVQQMTASPDFDLSVDSIINLSTDGSFNVAPALLSAESAKAAGIDALTAEAIGSGANVNSLLQLVFNPASDPNDGSGILLATDASPDNPLLTPPWVVPVSSFDTFGGVIEAKIRAIVTPGPEPVPETGVGYLLGFGLLLVLARRRMMVARCR